MTIQGENLGAVVQPDPEKNTSETERLVDSVKRAKTVFVCDSRPTTIELIRVLSPTIDAVTGLRLVASAPKMIEIAIPELKGRITTLAPPLSGNGGVVFAEELMAQGEKIFIGTALPDPLYGISDARVQASQNWIAGAHLEATHSRKDMEPTPFEKTDAYEAAEEFSSKIRGAKFLTVFPRGGRVRSVLEDAPFDTMRNGFVDATISPTRAMVVGTGGKGYDDTLSGALRLAWCALPGLRKSGQLLLVGECSEGIGSTALEMMATGRMKAEGRRKGDYVDGLEEVFYLNKLKEEYDVLLLSGLPDAYAKSNLGLTTARGSGEAVGRLLNKIGRTAKINVVTRAAECRIISG